MDDSAQSCACLDPPLWEVLQEVFTKRYCQETWEGTYFKGQGAPTRVCV